MKGKTTKIIIGVLIAAIVVVGGLLLVKSLTPETAPTPGASNSQEIKEGAPAATMAPAGAMEVG